mmetsp:Transcript_74637/g.140714  ORF Transcript_74637/g.140714 Transcript_74637/m.140714 type:complete len:668 (-) Transcript_74637:55-2058(-)
MKATYALIAALALFSTTTVVVEARAEVTPVQKVLQLLQGMLEKGKKEKHDEQVQYAAYKQFCDDTTTEKTRAIKEADEKISMLTADIAKYAAHAKQLTKEIAVHDLDISVWKGDMDAAGKVRKLEKSDYDALHLDYSESIDALKRAIIVLKDQAYDRKQASSLVQITNLNSLSLIPENAKKAIDLFLAQGLQTEDPVAAPEATGYDFQSTGIIEMLEKLLADFTDKKTEIEKEEMNAEHAYQMLMKDLTMQSDDASADRTAKAETKAAKLESKATAETDRSDTTKTMNADKKYLADTTATCASKAADFEARQQLRAEEIVAITEAIKIIESSSVSGAADKYLPSLAQKGRALTQLRASTNTQLQQRVVLFLRKEGKALNSRLLETLAARAEADPFTKVKKMIKDLIMRLEEEANAEADHKSWCDSELASNEQTRKEKTNAVETLQAEVDELKASIAKLTEEMGELADGVATLDQKMAENTELRTKEKETNEETITDAKEAQAAVSQALTVLKDFYAKAAEATSFAQQPEIFDSPYKGMQAENGGVVGMLEVILTDFERLEAETATSEASAQKLYTEFMADSKADKKAKERDIEHKTFEKQDESQALALKEKDLAGTEKELSAALEYWDKLKPSCVTVGMSYDERVSRRKQEIESLQQALTILSGEEA